jgi:hypothetical protein
LKRRSLPTKVSQRTKVGLKWNSAWKSDPAIGVISVE